MAKKKVPELPAETWVVIRVTFEDDTQNEFVHLPGGEWLGIRGMGFQFLKPKMKSWEILSFPYPPTYWTALEED